MARADVASPTVSADRARVSRAARAKLSAARTETASKPVRFFKVTAFEPTSRLEVHGDIGPFNASM
jgi:hypothetical protein